MNKSNKILFFIPDGDKILELQLLIITFLIKIRTNIIFKKDFQLIKSPPFIDEKSTFNFNNINKIAHIYFRKIKKNVLKNP